ncbi:MAG: c-type cytochrome [Actinomycetota bacterium]
MRHGLIDRLVVVITLTLVGASVVFALAANSSGQNRTDAVLSLEPDIEHGREIYSEDAQPTCASCHTLQDAGARSDVASNLDELQPSARATVESILSGSVAGHDREDYVNELSNRDLADVAGYLEAVAGQ